MIDPEHFIATLSEAGIRFVTGVPDSLLKDFGAALTAHYSADRHVIAANEGGAVGLAIGHYLAGGSPALVYLQNSGLGNAVNPLVSLADPQIHGIPIVLLIGWRGELLDGGAQAHDEPQHRKQGQITPALLEVLSIPYRLIDAATTDVKSLIEEVVAESRQRSGPVALLVRRNTFAHAVAGSGSDGDSMSREEAIRVILSVIGDDVPIVSTTGMASRELFELRTRDGLGHHREFLTVGGMGHASQIAAGVAIATPEKKILCLDGDGALLMHMGSLTISAACDNLLHVVINNGAHDSVGGQPTKGAVLDLTKIAAACGYGSIAMASNPAEIESNLQAMLSSNCSSFLEIKCRRGARPDLGRPDRSPAVNKAEFMSFLSGKTR
ncbi:MAG TPA: phosphonopyruvate decarboxylase [Thermoanaerobaculia bacterium]|nr:phosphonopyruvate decarboxylase [Thermoanaerobaculia bacterium]